MLEELQAQQKRTQAAYVAEKAFRQVQSETSLSTILGEDRADDREDVVSAPNLVLTETSYRYDDMQDPFTIDLGFREKAGKVEAPAFSTTSQKASDKKVIDEEMLSRLIMF